MNPDVVQQVEDIEMTPLILGDGVFPLRTFMLKPHGDAILRDDKRYFNYGNSRTRIVTEGVLGRKYVETLKLNDLACVVRP